MVNTYKPPFTDMSAFVADANAINAATKTAMKTWLTNLSLAIVPTVGTSAALPNFDQIPAATAALLVNEIAAFSAAITAHA